MIITEPSAVLNLMATPYLFSVALSWMMPLLRGTITRYTVIYSLSDTTFVTTTTNTNFIIMELQPGSLVNNIKVFASNGGDGSSVTIFSVTTLEVPRKYY